MRKELRIDGIFYLKMNDGETEQEAVDRFYHLMESSNVCVLDSPEFEEQDIQIRKEGKCYDEY